MKLARLQIYVLMALAIVILLRFLLVIQEGTKLASQSEINILYQITQIKDDCWYSIDQFFFQFPECHSANPGETYLLLGNLNETTDKSIFAKKRLIISVKKEIDASDGLVFSWKTHVFNWKSHIWNRISTPVLENLPYPHSMVLLSMLFGDQAVLGEETQQLFKLTGSTHLQAVSGYNFAVIAAGVHQITKKYAGMRKQGILVLFTGLMFFCIVGVQPSVIRAVGSLITVLTVRFFLMRQYNTLFYLGIVLYLMLFWRPLWLFSLNFQLSVAALVGIVAFSSQSSQLVTLLTQKLFKNSIKLEQLPVVGEVVTGFVTALAATVTTAPLILVYFHELSLLGIVISSLCAGILTVIVNAGFWTTLTAAFVYSTSLKGVVILWIKATLYFPLELFLSTMTWFSQFQQATLHFENFTWWHVLIWYSSLLFLKGLLQQYLSNRTTRERVFV